MRYTSKQFTVPPYLRPSTFPLCRLGLVPNKRRCVDRGCCELHHGLGYFHEIRRRSGPSHKPKPCRNVGHYAWGTRYVCSIGRVSRNDAYHQARAAHGACLPFTSILHDASFMVNKADVRAMERKLANEGSTDAQIAAMKDTNWVTSCRTRGAESRAHSSSCDGLTQ